MHDRCTAKALSRRQVLKRGAMLAMSPLVLAGCGGAESTTRAPARAAPQKSVLLRIGYQKSSTLLNLLRTRGTLESRFGPQVEVVWQQFAAGPQMLEALNIGSIDFGTTGEAPPVFAQAAGAPLRYIALERVGPKSEAILVRPDSEFHSAKDLQGKRVALNKGSNVHYFLVRALESVGLKYADVEAVFLPPADARVAFESGRVDAWAIWDPFAAAAIESGSARVLLDGQGLVENFQFYLSTDRLTEDQPDLLKTLVTELKIINDWGEGHRDQVAKFLAELLELDEQILRAAEQRRVYGVEAIAPDVVEYQQRVADTFFDLGLLPRPVRVADVVWNANKPEGS